jgi:hypothetical protein
LITTQRLEIHHNSQQVINEDRTLLQFAVKNSSDYTGYTWNRTFSKLLYNNIPQLELRTSLVTSQIQTLQRINLTQILSTNMSFQDDTWYNINVTLKDRTLSVYINTELKLTSRLLPTADLSFRQKNTMYIGATSGKNTVYNFEVLSESHRFNGHMGDLRIYNYSIPERFLELFMLSEYVGRDLVWNINSGDISYIETVERFFQHRLPPSKSLGYKIRISGHGVTDASTRILMEEYIRTIIKQQAPAGADLLAVEWVDTV